MFCPLGCEECGGLSIEFVIVVVCCGDIVLGADHTTSTGDQQ